MISPLVSQHSREHGPRTIVETYRGTYWIAGTTSEVDAAISHARFSGELVNLPTWGGQTARIDPEHVRAVRRWRPTPVRRRRLHPLARVGWWLVMIVGYFVIGLGGTMALAGIAGVLGFIPGGELATPGVQPSYHWILIPAGGLVYYAGGLLTYAALEALGVD